MTRWWKDLSVSKKLYSVVGIMALLIAFELFTLLFAMKTLSAVRALVHGEALWSKAQKDAIQSLQQYVITQDELFFQHFQQEMKVPLGDHRARKALEQPKLDMTAVTEGFVAGKIHPNDVPPIVHLLRRFHDVDYVARAIVEWRKGDEMVFKLLDMGDRIRREVHENQKKPLTAFQQKAALERTLREISHLNGQFTVIENAFSDILGEASRWLEGILMVLLVLAVIIVESTGLWLTVTFSKSLNRSLKELNEVTHKVGSGDFMQTVPTRSRDELGQLAEAINTMTMNLRKQVSQRQQAEHASRVKNLFLANMSHEIRTPLNSILGFSDLLRDPTLTEAEKKKYLDVIKRTGTNLATIINDILDVTRVEAEQIEIVKSEFSLSQLLNDLQLLLQIRCEEKGVQLSVEKIGEVSEYIQTDSIRLRQILLNVIGNAIKFTEKGSIDVRYQVVDQQLCFTVKDTGPGITSSQLEQLFQPFSQGDSSIRKKFGGTGLGLVLSKKLAQLLGGDVSLVESVAGKGSTFLVKVAYVPVSLDEAKKSEMQKRKAAEANRDKNTHEALVSLQNKKILVVEDTKENQWLLQFYLTKSGAKVEVANNGEEGVQQALNEDFDLILMDMQMPVMDGYAATEILREKGYKKPIIALTGFAMIGDREKTLQSGCTDYLSKPVEKQKLLEFIARYVNSQTG